MRLLAEALDALLHIIARGYASPRNDDWTDALLQPLHDRHVLRRGDLRRGLGLGSTGGRGGRRRRLRVSRLRLCCRRLLRRRRLWLPRRLLLRRLGRRLGGGERAWL